MMRKLPNFITTPDWTCYNSENYLVLDFETTGLTKGSALNPKNKIILAVWSYQGKTKIKWAGEYYLQELVADCKQADFIVAHNAKFELQWLERCGVDLTDILVFDTMIAAYVLGGNRLIGSALSLDKTAEKELGEKKSRLVSKLIKSGVCPSQIPRQWLEQYCLIDVNLCERLFEKYRLRCKELGLLPVLYTRCLLTPVLADIEKNGMMLNPVRVDPLWHEKEKEYERLTIELNTITGGINTNSPKQLGEYIYGTLGFKELTDRRGNLVRTVTGRPKTNLDTIYSLKAKTKRQKNFFATYKRCRELHNELTKYLRKFHNCVSDNSGLITGSFNQCRTRTHRLSSTGQEYNTQFQNFPRIYKKLFHAKNPEWLIGEADGSQLEFRVAAHLGRDTIALNDILEGRDIHSVTADIIGCSRQDAKAHTFKPLYGGRSGTLNERKYYDFFREKYTGISSTQQRWVDTVLERKSLKTEWGLTYYWPDTNMDAKTGYVTNTTAICNYPVQALATAEIIPIALVYFWHRLKCSDLKMQIVNTVHDSIICELPEDEKEEFMRLSQQCLIEDVYRYLQEVYGIRFTVPLGCGVKTGTHWSEGVEKKYEASTELFAA